jgi:multidrug efflux pump subunit AcrA (membrane-fusion protein)
LAVRAEINNPGLKLKPKMFARMKILAEKKLVPCIPKRAVQDAGSQKVVYIQLGNNRFKETVIELGEESESYFEVTKGLRVGDKVVTKGSFTLRAQALKQKRT